MYIINYVYLKTRLKTWTKLSIGEGRKNIRLNLKIRGKVLYDNYDLIK